MEELDTRFLIRIGRRWHWQPSASARKLGFGNIALGENAENAAKEADRLNRRVHAARTLAKQPPADESFQHLVDIYRGNGAFSIPPSREWIRLSSKTQKDYGSYLDRLVSIWGPCSVSSISAEAVRELRDQMAATPYVANYVLRVLGVVFSFAMERPKTFGVLSTNPAHVVSKFGVKDGVKSRQRYWSEQDEGSFTDIAKQRDWEIYVAHALLIYTGQRPEDVRAMTEDDYDGEKIKVTQQKTGTHVWIPAHRDLKALLAEHLAWRRAGGRIKGTILQTKRGLPFTERYFAERWDSLAVPAGIVDLKPVDETTGKRPRREKSNLQRRDLRRTAVVRLSEAGCTVPEIASITGHSIKTVETILATYHVRTYRQAQSAIAKLEAAQTKNDGRLKDV